MKITLEKHGGLAALKFRPKTIDAADLPAEQASELARLAAAAKSPGAASAGASDKIRDALTYTVTIEDGADTVTLTQSDGGLSPAFSALLAWINRQPGR